MAHIVHCRVCKKEINIDSTTDWMMPSRNYYYHVECYNDWIKDKQNRAVQSEHTADEWYLLLKEYLWRDVKMPNIDWGKISSQWQNFTTKSNRFTPKGVYFAILYFYEIQHGDPKAALGGIGIVPSIYQESAQYWANLEARRAGTLDNIVKQMILRQSRPVLSILEKSSKKNKRPKYSLDEIGGDEDDG